MGQGRPVKWIALRLVAYFILSRYFRAALESAYQREVMRKAPDAEMKAKKPTREKRGFVSRKKTERVERARNNIENSEDMKMCFLLPSR